MFLLHFVSFFFLVGVTNDNIIEPTIIINNIHRTSIIENYCKTLEG